MITPAGRERLPRLARLRIPYHPVPGPARRGPSPVTARPSDLNRTHVTSPFPKRSPGNGRPAGAHALRRRRRHAVGEQRLLRGGRADYCDLLEARGHSAETGAPHACSTSSGCARRPTATASTTSACRCGRPAAPSLGEHCDTRSRRLDAGCEGIRRQPMALLPGRREDPGGAGGQAPARHADQGRRPRPARQGGAVGTRASGLRAVDVVKEKDPHAYELALARHGADPATSWMIGQQPEVRRGAGARRRAGRRVHPAPGHVGAGTRPPARRARTSDCWSSTGSSN